ncbi:MAG: hypothetical protein ACOCP4_07370 [Candidatus Woesearchaeota archaeon]
METNLNKGHWTGSCKRCGKCCRINHDFYEFKTETKPTNPPKDFFLDFIKDKGFRILQISDKCIHVEFDDTCMGLVGDNICKFHETDEKPIYCQKWPVDIDISDYTSLGLDISKSVPEGCGFVWVKDT